MMQTLTNLKDLIEGDRSKIPMPLVRLAQKRAINQIKNISKGTIKNNDNPKKIIFNRVYATYDKTLYQVIGIAKALQLEGHDVKFLLCNNRFKTCSNVFSIHQKSKRICDNCSVFGSEILKACDIPYETYTNILSQYKRNSNYPSHLEQTINNSLVRYFKGYDDFSQHPDFDKVKNDRSCNANDSLNAAKIIYEKENPDIIYTSSCTYTEWGPFAQYMQSKGVKCIVWAYTYGEDVIFDIEKINDVFTKYKKEGYSLTESERALVHKHMKDRKYGNIEDTKIYSFNNNQEIINKNKYDNVYAMFPNVPWDSSLVNANKIFNSVREWIDTTINHFKSNTNNFLYIKIHPAEFIHKSYTTIVDYINKNFSPLPDNIKIINDKNVNPYVLGESIDVCIVYNGTTGVEMSIFGIPTIVVGHIYCEDKGFTYEPETVDDYCDLLTNPPPKLNNDQIKKAEEFGYYYLIKNRLPMTYVSHNNLGAYFAFNDFNDVLKHKSVQKTLRYILDDVHITQKTILNNEIDDL